MARDHRLDPLRDESLEHYRLPDGSIIPLFALLAHAPVALADLKGATARALQATRLSTRPREVLILRILHKLRAHAEIDVHIALFAVDAAFSPQDLAAIGDPAGTLPNQDGLMLRVADALVGGGHLDDSLWADLEETLGREGAVEAIFIGAQYVKVALLNNALEVPRPAPQPPPAGDGASTPKR